jgi:hypothetical protein
MAPAREAFVDDSPDSPVLSHVRHLCKDLGNGELWWTPLPILKPMRNVQGAVRLHDVHRLVNLMGIEAALAPNNVVPKAITQFDAQEGYVARLAAISLMLLHHSELVDVVDGPRRR